VQGAVGSNPATPIQSEAGFPSRLLSFLVSKIHTHTYVAGVFVGQLCGAVGLTLPHRD
jgi:hypothetical protein